MAVASAGLLPHVTVEDNNPQYSFAYGVKDVESGDDKAQHETREGGVVRGQYSLVEPDGSRRIVDYTADDVNGFQAVVSKQEVTPVVTPVVAPVVPVVKTVVAPAPVLKTIVPVAAPAPVVSHLVAPAAPVQYRTVVASAPHITYAHSVQPQFYHAQPVVHQAYWGASPYAHQGHVVYNQW